MVSFLEATEAEARCDGVSMQTPTHRLACRPGWELAGFSFSLASSWRDGSRGGEGEGKKGLGGLRRTGPSLATHGSSAACRRCGPALCWQPCGRARLALAPHPLVSWGMQGPAAPLFAKPKRWPGVLHNLCVTNATSRWRVGLLTQLTEVCCLESGLRRCVALKVFQKGSWDLSARAVIIIRFIP